MIETASPASGTEAPTLSVIIPIHNGKGIFEAAVQTVLQQQGVAFEVLLIDDGSRDDSPNSAQALATCDPRIRFARHPTTQGVAATLNHGVRLARAELLLILHQDCRLEGSDWLHRATTVLESTGSVAVVGRPFHRAADMDRTEKRFWIIRNHIYPTVPREHLPSPRPLFSETKCDLIRKDALQQVGGFDEAVGPGGEDQILSLALLDHRFRVEYSNDLWYQIALGGKTNARSELRRDYKYGREMVSVLRRTRRRAVRRSDDGSLDPRMTNRVSGLAWPVALVLALTFTLLTGSILLATLSALVVVLRVVQLEVRSLRAAEAYQLRGLDFLAVGPLGLGADLAYNLGGVVGAVDPGRGGRS